MGTKTKHITRSFKVLFLVLKSLLFTHIVSAEAYLEISYGEGTNKRARAPWSRPLNTPLCICMLFKFIHNNLGVVKIF